MSYQHHSGEREQASTRSNAASLQQQGIQRKAVEPRLKAQPAQLEALKEDELPKQAKMIDQPAQLEALSEDDLPKQAKMINQPAQLEALSEDELPKQAKMIGQPAQLAAIEDEAPAQTKSAVQLKANNTGMPDQLKTGIESTSGLDMSDVKVHYNSSQPAQLNAHAYAQGTDIHIAPGQEKHLPHEAWHVVQQKQGRVQATTQLKADVPVNDDPHLEAEADVMGQKSLQQFS